MIGVANKLRFSLKVGVKARSISRGIASSRPALARILTTDNIDNVSTRKGPLSHPRQGPH